MGKKILFAVMALLVMATGKIWAQDTAEKTPYAVLYQNTENAIGSLYFMYTNEDVTQTNKTTEIKNDGSSDAPTPITLTYSKHWEIDLTSYNPAWNSATEKAQITEVVFEESFKEVKVTSCFNWFNGFTKLEKIGNIKYLDTSNVKDMSSMFYNCEALTSLDLSSFNTSQVENMSSMFQGCKALTSLDLRSFNTSQVGNMNQMFSNCQALTTLDLSSFNTSSVTDMDNMFYGCSSLNSLTLGSFDMSGVTNENNLKNMFGGYNKNNITIKGNALVFVTSDTQKGVWTGFKNNVKLMVKKNGEDKYVSDGTVDITLDNDKDTPVIFPHVFPADNVTFKRTFKAGNPHTVCLPFAVNATEYGTFYTFKEYKDNKVIFEKLTADKTTTTANTPYLFIPKDGITEITAKNTVIFSTTDDNMHNTDNFIGVYEKLTFTDKFLLADNSGYDYYGWTSNTDGNGYFRKAGAGASVAPCRAYIRLAKGGAGIGSAPARLSVEYDDGETTGISSTVSSADGGADAPMYNLQGQRVSGGYKGVVIKNGKKMIVR